LYQLAAKILAMPYAVNLFSFICICMYVYIYTYYYIYIIL
jgi:hypothetical protein